MASQPSTHQRPKGRSLSSLRMVWGFASRYPLHIAGAGLALLSVAFHRREL